MVSYRTVTFRPGHEANLRILNVINYSAENILEHMAWWHVRFNIGTMTAWRRRKHERKFHEKQWGRRWQRGESQLKCEWKMRSYRITCLFRGVFLAQEELHGQYSVKAFLSSPVVQPWIVQVLCLPYSGQPVDSLSHTQVRFKFADAERWRSGLH